MTPALDVEVIKESVMETLLSLITDAIPNIRFNVAKAFEVIATTYGSSAEGNALIKERVVPALQQLAADSDADVRYFASRALQLSTEKLAGSCFEFRTVTDH